MEQRGCIFRFADIQVDERNFSVTKAGEVLPLEPKVFKVLQFLLHHADRVVTKDELLEAVWNDCSVSESSLTRSVAVLRRLLGDDIHEPRYIATVPTVGYPVVSAGRQSPNLFSLGNGRTLSLINGRRVVSSSPGIFGGGVDTNSIPVDLIERVAKHLDRVTTGAKL